MNTAYKYGNGWFIAICICLFAVTSCKDDEGAQTEPVDLVMNEDAEIALDWMDLYLEIDRYVRDFRPGPAARSLAYINLAAYEASMKGMPDYKSLQPLFPGLSIPVPTDKDLHFPTVLNTVYADLFKRFIPASYILPEYQSDLQFEILALEESYNNLFKSMTGADMFNRSQDYGEDVATAVWEWSKTDPFGHLAFENAWPDGYVPPNGPGLWQPTPPELLPAYFPYWGKARTFALAQTEKLAAEPTPFNEANTSQFYVQALEVRNTVTTMEFEDQWVAEFWNDEEVGLTFSPVARWISIANQVIENDGCHLETTLYAFAKLSLALNDASIAALHSKYTFNVERPVTFIHRVLDDTWTPYLSATPSSPSYPSGHAVYAAAAAEVLSHVFRYNYAMTDKSHDERTDFLGMPRSFNTFYQMADEAAYSRIAAGVNFRMDVEEGLNLGFKVGRKVNEMPFK